MADITPSRIEPLGEVVALAAATRGALLRAAMTTATIAPDVAQGQGVRAE